MTTFHSAKISVLTYARLTMVLAFWLVTHTAFGGALRVSFLDDPVALNDTCNVLRDAGFPAQALSTFVKVVTSHNKGGISVDRTKFPQLQDGFYGFRDISDLTNRLHCPFGRVSSGTPTLMCFDVASLLLSGAGYGAPRLEQEFGSSGIVLPMPEGLAISSTYSVFRTAYSLALQRT